MSEHRWVKAAWVTDVQCVCYNCSRRFMLSTGWADSKGEPFKAYYCAACKEKADERA